MERESMSLQIEMIPIYLEDEEGIEEREEWLNDEKTHQFKTLDKTINKTGIETIRNTKIRNKKLLQESIIQFLDQSEIHLKENSNKSITFRKSTEGTYDIIYDGYWNEKEINMITKGIEETYNTIAQEKTYQKVLKAIKQKGYKLEKETVTDQNTRVLTLSI